MHKLSFFLPLTGLFLFSCGSDLGGRDSSPEVQTPTITTEDENHSVASQMIRLRGTTTLTSLEEITNIINGTVTANFRTIPIIGIDDEGSSLNVTTRQTLGRPSNDCGNTSGLSGINNRIANCVTTNSTKSSWSGTSFGHAGESVWKLVYNTASAEVWLDSRTGLVWSDVVATSNWCAASGNAEDVTSSGGTANSVDCDTAAGSIKVCKNLMVDGLGSNVTWRLPTRNDYLQAELDGIRFVLKPSTLSFWTATVDSTDTNRAKAWLFNSVTGNIASDSMLIDHPVRCVGAPVR